MKPLAATLAGLLFGLGLMVSGMADPGKVITFLDPLHGWDPSLALVMAGGLLVARLGFARAWAKPNPWLAPAFAAPTRTAIDRPLLVGAALFGAGWGLAGICPGPALVLVGAGSLKGIGFALAMLSGMAIHARTAR